MRIVLTQHALKAGTMIKLPDYVPMYQDQQTSTSFDKFKEIMLGSLSPQVMIAPAQSVKRHHHSFFSTLARVIVVAIVIVAAVEFAPSLVASSAFLTALSAQLSTATVTTVVSGVLAGLGDAAIQEVAVKLNMQSSISFNEILETAVSGGMGSALGSLSLSQMPTMPELAKQSLEIGATEVMTQLVEMEAGTRERFDPNSIMLQVAASALAPYVSKGVDVASNSMGMNDTSISVARNIANTTSNAVLGRGITNAPISVENMAANMIGTDVSNRVGSSLHQALNNEDALQNALLDSNNASKDKATNVFQSRTNHASYVDPEIMKAEIVANMSLPSTDIDWSNANYQLSEMNRVSMVQRWNSARGKSWGDVRNARNDMVIPNGYDQIHDVTDFALGFGSSMFKGTLMGSTLDSIRQTRENARAIIYGDSATRAQGVENFGKDIALTVGLGATGGIIGEVAEAVLPSIGRMSLFGGGVVNVSKAGISEVISGVFNSAKSHPLYGLSVENVVRLTNEIGLETPKDQLILWSGLGRNGVELSQEYARLQGGVTLEMTPGGKWLNEMNLFGIDSPFTPDEATKIWADTSTLMARQAAGQVRSLLGQVRPRSIYMANELPELYNNVNVIGIDESNIKPKYIFG